MGVMPENRLLITMALPLILSMLVQACYNIAVSYTHLDVYKRQERKRLSKELEKKKKYQGGIEKKLSNEKFLAKAPEDVVQREKDNLAKAQKEIEQLESSLAALG